MFKTSYKIATVWGIPIRVHVSILIVLAWLVLKESNDHITALHNLIVGVLLFTSIALHELGHSFIAIKKGCRVQEITLMFMGGVAKMERIPSKPMDEFKMAIAGPAVSLFLGLTGLFSGLYLMDSDVKLLKLLGEVLFAMGFINLILAIFNLIPAFPMDGGRVLRALLTKRAGRLKATYVASRIGKFVAIAFGIIGLFGIRGVPGFDRTNLVLVAIGIFIYFAAKREYIMVQMQEAAKNSGFATWTEDGPDDMVDDDVVTVSPPPYEKGPGSRSELQSGSRKRTFRNPWR